MSIKKQGVLVVSVFLFITTFLFRPANVFAVESCDNSGCSDEKCTACCRKFQSDSSLGIERFRVKGYEKSFQKSCKRYMKFIKGKRVKANDANYCLSVCTNSKGKNLKSSCFKKCCKEFNCSKKDLSKDSTTTDTNTATNTNSTQNTANSKNVNSPGSNDITTCEGLLGDKANTDSVAWLVQKILDYLKIIGPLLVVVLSSVDFAKAIVMNDDENMKKAQKKLITRLLAAVLLFFIPTVVQMLLDIFGITSCNIY